MCFAPLLPSDVPLCLERFEDDEVEYSGGRFGVGSAGGGRASGGCGGEGGFIGSSRGAFDVMSSG